MRGLDCRVGVVWRAIGSCGPDFTATWVVDIESLARLGLNPLAANVRLVFEDLGIVDLFVRQLSLPAL